MRRILLIDDESYILERYYVELSDMRHEVSTARSGYELMKKIKVFQPDLIILDIRFTDCDGLDLMQEIRNCQPDLIILKIGLTDCDGLDLLQEIRNCHPDLSVIICSAYDTYRNDSRALAADYYVSFDLSELKTKVKRALEAKVPLRTRTFEREDLDWGRCTQTLPAQGKDKPRRFRALALE